MGVVTLEEKPTYLPLGTQQTNVKVERMLLTKYGYTI